MPRSARKQVEELDRANVHQLANNKYKQTAARKTCGRRCVNAYTMITMTTHDNSLTAASGGAHECIVRREAVADCNGRQCSCSPQVLFEHFAYLVHESVLRVNTCVQHSCSMLGASANQFEVNEIRDISWYISWSRGDDVAWTHKKSIARC